ncbi:MAG: rod shape-determining protein RodA [Bacteroidales bacterium]|nr:rod shape-determining protein RodA [Bacteroidales bacterium]
MEKKRLDFITILLYLAIVLFGWFNIYAAVFDESHAAILDFGRQHGKQLIWMGLAAFSALVVTLVEPKIFSNTAYIIYGVVLLLLVVVLLIGQTTNGGQSWINFGAFKFQPSEFAKFGTALAISKFMSAIDLDFKNLRTKIYAFTIILIPAALILLQHDTGSALVFASFVFPFFREGLSGMVLLLGLVAIVLFVLALLINKYLLIGIVLVICIAYLFIWLNRRTIQEYLRVIIFFASCTLFIFSVNFVFNNVLESHQRDRIYVLLGKVDDPKGTGYNVDQAKIAIGSGGFMGKGWTKGTITKADFVPEQETDFIFCTVGEEWGFVGSAALICLYIGLLVRLVFLAERQRSTFARFYGYSVASILFMHVLINIGMVLGLAPVIGIPLPFFSYGGSSLLAFTILLFIFLRQDADRNALL